MDLHSDHANWWSFPHAQSNKNPGSITNNNSLTSDGLVFHILVKLCAQTGSDIRDDQLFQNKFQNFCFFRACKRTKWLNIVNFWSSFIVLLPKNVRLWIQLHTYEIFKKNHGKTLWPNLAGQNLPFSVRDPWGRRYQIFSNQNFSSYIPTKFRIEYDIQSSNQTGAIPTAKFQNWVCVKWTTCIKKKSLKSPWLRKKQIRSGFFSLNFHLEKFGILTSKDGKMVCYMDSGVMFVPTVDVATGKSCLPFGFIQASRPRAPLLIILINSLSRPDS